MQKEQLQAEELSKAIDALNQQLPHRAIDPDTIKLLNTARYVKQYGQPSAQAEFIDQFAGQLSADISARRRRRNIVRMVTGVAAATLLFVGVSMFPAPSQIAKHPDTVVVPSGVVEPQLDQPQVAMGNNSPITIDGDAPKQAAPAASPRQSSPPAKKSPVVKAPSAQPSPTNPPVVASAPQAAQSQPTQAPMAMQARVAPIQAEHKQTAVLVLPNRQADVVIADQHGVKHIYAQNTDQELVITQRNLNSANTRTVDKRSRQNNFNKITRQIDNIVVEVEGRQAPAELERLAATLISVDTDTNNDNQNNTETNSNPNNP